MLALELRFPAGQYHATPWGRHVNEADVAWPPDPWRLLRALIATWHRKADTVAFPYTRLEQLIAALAELPPAYALPTGVQAHTRHYMPGRGGSTSLVFDAFARLDPQRPLYMVWPELQLVAEMLQLLDTLVLKLGYLGRAESWVEARRIPDWDGALNCWPAASAVDPETGEVLGDLIQLGIPKTAGDYAEFRTRILGESKQRKARKGDYNQLAKSIPEDWLAAIGTDTAVIKKAGWSAPPAARPIGYLRPAGCLRSSIPPKTGPAMHSATPITTARFALYGTPLPRIQDTLRVGEWLRNAVIGVAGDRLGHDRVPPLLSGHGLGLGNRHQHGFYLAEDADNDGLIDHLLVHLGGGLGKEEQAVLNHLTRLWNYRGQEWKLILEGTGRASGFSAVSPLLGHSAEWVSCTPYLHPWYRKKRFGPEQQIRRECRLRGLPELAEVLPLSILRINGREVRPYDFQRYRGKRGLTQPDQRGGLYILNFKQPITGPLALGFGCHFGLGMFQATNQV